jgi:hypothetical protein
MQPRVPSSWTCMVSIYSPIMALERPRVLVKICIDTLSLKLRMPYAVSLSIDSSRTKSTNMQISCESYSPPKTLNFFLRT